MGEAIAAVLGPAAGIAISPVPIVALILVLFSRRARGNSVAFTFAWILGIVTLTASVALIPGLDPDGSSRGHVEGWIRVGVGVAFLVAAGREWWLRPRRGEEAELPAWMGTIDGLTAGPTFGLGFVLSVVNPKNFTLAAAAGASISASGLTGGELAAVVAVFTAVAASSIVVPVAAYLALGHRMDDVFDTVKDALTRNRRTVLAVIFLLVGLGLGADGVSILSA